MLKDANGYLLDRGGDAPLNHNDSFDRTMSTAGHPVQLYSSQVNFICIAHLKTTGVAPKHFPVQALKA